MTFFGFPYRLDGRGRTADADPDRHIRDLIEQVLFVTPGERVNNPTFGSGLLGLTFAAQGDTLAAAAQVIVQAALQQWLGDLIQVQAVDVRSLDSTVAVTVAYVVVQTQEQRLAQFERGV